MTDFKTPYVPHFFKEQIKERLGNRLGWFSAGIATSVPWPQEDVLVVYDGTEFLLRGVAATGGKLDVPCINTPCQGEDYSDALAKVLRFCSVLGWFKHGYVDVTGFTYGTHPTRYGTRDAHASISEGRAEGFDCNYMPIIEDDKVRIALAFIREGRRLSRVHDAYAFLSFFKVLESQFNDKGRIAFIDKHLDKLDDRAAKRVAELRKDGVDVGIHLFKSGRCAVAHAGLGRDIVDPDEPHDRQRIVADMDVIKGLAHHYLSDEIGVPDEQSVYRNRDRLAPWHSLLTPEGLAKFKAKQQVQDVAELGRLHGSTVSVRRWPQDPAPELTNMKLHALTGNECGASVFLVNERETIVLAFYLDFAAGRVHPELKEGGLNQGKVMPTEDEVAAFTRYFHASTGSAQFELLIEGRDPVQCEGVRMVNIIPRSPEEAVKEAVEAYRLSRQSQ
jgi:hypothetical protein